MAPDNNVEADDHVVANHHVAVTNNITKVDFVVTANLAMGECIVESNTTEGRPEAVIIKVKIILNYLKPLI